MCSGSTPNWPIGFHAVDFFDIALIDDAGRRHQLQWETLPAIYRASGRARDASAFFARILDGTEQGRMPCSGMSSHCRRGFP